MNWSKITKAIFVLAILSLVINQQAMAREGGKGGRGGGGGGVGGGGGFGGGGRGGAPSMRGGFSGGRSSSGFSGGRSSSGFSGGRASGGVTSGMRSSGGFSSSRPGFSGSVRSNSGFSSSRPSSGLGGSIRSGSSLGGVRSGPVINATPGTSRGLSNTPRTLPNVGGGSNSIIRSTPRSDFGSSLSNRLQGQSNSTRSNIRSSVDGARPNIITSPLSTTPDPTASNLGNRVRESVRNAPSVNRPSTSSSTFRSGTSRPNTGMSSRIEDAIRSNTNRGNRSGVVSSGRSNLDAAIRGLDGQARPDRSRDIPSAFSNRGSTARDAINNGLRASGNAGSWNRNWNHGNWNHHSHGGHWNSPSRYNNYYASRNSYFFGRYSPFGSYAWPRYGYGYGYHSYYYPVRYGYPWGLVASRLLIGLPYFSYSPVCSYRFGGYGYDYYSSYTTYYSSPSTYYYQPSIISSTTVLPATESVVEVERPVDSTEAVPAESEPVDFAGQGEVDFKAGNYDAAIKNWQHALVDDPGNGALIMLLGQAYFASGRYDEAAGATQHAMQILPEETWDVILKNRSELYPDASRYAEQLRALEAAREKNDSPALRFLLGYHYSFIGETGKATAELDKTLEMAPGDEIARKLREKISGVPSPVPAPVPAAEPSPTADPATQQLIPPAP